MAAAAILGFSEAKCDVIGSHRYVTVTVSVTVSVKTQEVTVCTSNPNFVKLRKRAAEFWRFMSFQNGSRPPSWIFAAVKFGGISVSGTSVLVSEPNFVRICAIATELWPFK